ncbi:MAG: hypothetical protein Ct9H300mP1_18110 [Planctomycetaceae bacterium]|nr:MAG: hypothetical protein Ct9H300mP1_18110 [Planctomycetaceae bacterium]
MAKRFHPDFDHRYRITAEVVDGSRRTIVGTGSVMVARQPFRVVTWVDRGFYRTGQTIRASVQARTLDGPPVPGEGPFSRFTGSATTSGGVPRRSGCGDGIPPPTTRVAPR